MGPGGCDPLVRPMRQRIARAAPDWYPPQTTSFNLTTTPVQVAPRDTSRAVIAFALTITVPPSDGGAAAIGISRAQIAGGCAVCFMGAEDDRAGSPFPFARYKCALYSYEQHGALPTEEWWAAIVGDTISAKLCITTWRFMG